MRAWVPLLIALLVTGGVLTAAAMVYSSWETQRRARLAQLTARLQRPPKLKVARAAVLDHPLERAALALVTRAGPPHTVARLTLWMVCAATFGAIAMALMAGPLAGALGLAAGGLPLLWLRRQGNLRSEQLAEQLPEAFELVGRSLRAGHAFPDALRSAGRDVPAPLGHELALVADRNRLGLGMRACLMEFAQRQAGNMDVQLFVSTVLLHQESGGNLVETLQQLADTIRDRKMAREKLAALTAEVRMSAMIVGGLPFFVSGVLLFIRPTYLLPLIETTYGRILLGVAIGSLTIGFTAMRAVSQVED